jgi:branched-subunit amino acid ABC-type transport system permease component
MKTFLFQGLVGLSEAMYLWLVAAGLSLIFGVLRVTNFAHGSLYMLGAYATFYFFGLLGNNFWLGLAVGPLVVAGVGLLMERFFLRLVYRLEVAYQLLLTFAFVLIFNDLVKMIWGPIYRVPPTPAGLDGSITILGLPYPTYNLFIIAVGPLVALGLWFLLEKTRWGRLIVASASDKEMANALGINVPRLYTLVFMLGAWLAALGGALSIPIRSVSPGMGEVIIIEAFIVVVIGGLGSLKGAFVGAILIGLLHVYGVRYLQNFEMALAFMLMATILIIRPWGLFGTRGT